MAHELVVLAMEAIKFYLESGETASAPEDSCFQKRRAGVFVSLKKQGMLRGCIGTISPENENIAQETMNNAVKAAVGDPRFPPLKPEELPEISCSVDVLSEPEPAEIQDLDAEKYGVVVESGWKKGLLLPDLEGIDSPAEQVEIAKQKAGIMPGEPFRLYRFKVERFR